MFRSTDTGTDRVCTFVELVSLFRRPVEPVRECSWRGCHRPAFRDEVRCQEHEAHHRLGYYDPDRGWEQP